MADRERRYRFIRVSPEILMQAVFNPRLDGDVVRCVRVDGLPDDLEVVRVGYEDVLGHQFYLLLYHPSWDVVPAGGRTPEAQVQITTFLRQLAPEGGRRGREFI